MASRAVDHYVHERVGNFLGRTGNPDAALYPDMVETAMQAGSFDKKLSGEVEADETFIGGKIRNTNSKAKARKILNEGRLAGGGMAGKKPRR